MRQAEEVGLGVAGWHLDLQGVPGTDGAALAGALRDELDPSLLLSATLPRDAFAADGIEELTEATDFVVSFLYGIREGDPDDPAAWDFQQVQAAAKKLAVLEEPFLVGVVVRGAVTLLRGGAEAGEIPGASLAELAWNRRLRLRHGFSLEGVDRQVYAFSAAYPTRVAETSLVAGDNVRVVGTSTAHLQELRRQIAGWKLDHCLGELYYRLPHPGEALTLGAASLARIGAEEVALPVPRVVVEKLGESPGRLTIWLTLAQRLHRAERPRPGGQQLRRAVGAGRRLRRRQGRAVLPLRRLRAGGQRAGGAQPAQPDGAAAVRAAAGGGSEPHQRTDRAAHRRGRPERSAHTRDVPGAATAAPPR